MLVLVRVLARVQTIRRLKRPKQPDPQGRSRADFPVLIRPTRDSPVLKYRLRLALKPAHCPGQRMPERVLLLARLLCDEKGLNRVTVLGNVRTIGREDVEPASLGILAVNQPFRRLRDDVVVR